MYESKVFELVETGETSITGLTLEELVKIANDAEIKHDKLNVDAEDGLAYMWMHMGRDAT